MSRISNTLKTLLLLKSRGKMTASDLSKELFVGPRMVRTYIDDLNKAQFTIESTPGKNGGYVLNDKGFIWGLKLSSAELTALSLAMEQISKSNVVYKSELESALEKITLAACENGAACLDQEKKMSIKIQDSMITRNKIEIEYIAFKESKAQQSIIISPYTLCGHQNNLYVVGYSEKENEVRDYNISCIQDIKVLHEKYEYDTQFCIDQYMNNSTGIFQD